MSRPLGISLVALLAALMAQTVRRRYPPIPERPKSASERRAEREGGRHVRDAGSDEARADAAAGDAE
jgi:hypothetical protein